MTWKNSVNMPHVALIAQDPTLFVEEISISKKSAIDNFSPHAYNVAMIHTPEEQGAGLKPRVSVMTH